MIPNLFAARLPGPTKMSTPEFPSSTQRCRSFSWVAVEGLTVLALSVVTAGCSLFHHEKNSAAAAPAPVQAAPAESAPAEDMTATEAAVASSADAQPQAEPAAAQASPVINPGAPKS